jgi:Tfp pilus assembly protein PilV
MIRPVWKRPTHGFTVVETVTALGLLMMGMIMVTQIAAWSIQERIHSAVRQESTEIADNVLEAARSRPWEELTARWASEQYLPEATSKRLQGARLSVKVGVDSSTPLVKRVSVEVAWPEGVTPAMKAIHLVELIGPRTMPASKDKL